MITLARKDAAEKALKPPQVAFVKAVLTEKLPIESNSVDCILSNCIPNLLSMEGRVSLFKELYRILKPEGRVILDDVGHFLKFPKILSFTRPLDCREKTNPRQHKERHQCPLFWSHYSGGVSINSQGSWVVG